MIKEVHRTDKINWWVDLHGRGGKTILIHELRKNPEYNVLYIQLETRSRFRKILVDEIVEHNKIHKKWPSAILIDCPRDEERDNLHNVYGVLEKANDGVLQTGFYGAGKMADFPMGIPIHVFSNAIPIYEGMSPTRWNILGVFEVLILEEDSKVPKKDFYCFQIEAFNAPCASSYSSVNWQPRVKTLPPQEPVFDENGNKLTSYLLLQEMWSKHRDTLKHDKDIYINEYGEDGWIKASKLSSTKYRVSEDGVIEAYGPVRSATFNKAPESVLKSYTYEFWKSMSEPEKVNNKKERKIFT